MKKILFLFLVIAQVAYTQNDVIFKINHLIGSTPITPTVKGSNNLDQTFSLSRMQYYISEISIVHDGNQTTDIVDTWLLINAFETTEITLGSFDIDSIESIHFSIGVDSQHNHLDPSTYPSNHALSPQSPSMHWGWAGGYRFIAMEGLAGGNVFELHAVGEPNYKEIVLNYSETGAQNNELIIDINADYNQAVRDLDLLAGLSIHGDETDPEVVIAITNFKDHVFSAKEGEVEEPNAINNLENDLFIVYPNPSEGIISIKSSDANRIVVKNVLGQIIFTKTNLQSLSQFDIEEKGIHMIQFFSENNKLLATKKILVH